MASQQGLALGLTIILELIAIFPIWKKKWINFETELKSLVLIVGAASLISHPICWFIILDLNLPISFGLSVFAAEVTICLLEALIFMYFFKITIQKSLLLAIYINAFSFLMGFILNEAFR